MAHDRMRVMHEEIAVKDGEILNLTVNKQESVESKFNLKSDLKKALTLCKDISDKKADYKHKAKKLKEKQKSLQGRLSLLEVQKGLDKLSSDQLQQLEGFYFKALDSVKNAKFRKKYETHLSMINHQDSILESSPDLSENGKILDNFGLSEDLNLSDSGSDISLEFKGSFYKTKTDNHDVSFLSSYQDISAVMLVNLLENDMSHNSSPQKTARYYRKSPLTENNRDI